MDAGNMLRVPLPKGSGFSVWMLLRAGLTCRIFPGSEWDADHEKTCRVRPVDPAGTWHVCLFAYKGMHQACSGWTSNRYFS